MTSREFQRTSFAFPHRRWIEYDPFTLIEHPRMLYLQGLTHLSLESFPPEEDMEGNVPQYLAFRYGIDRHPTNILSSDDYSQQQQKLLELYPHINLLETMRSELNDILMNSEVDIYPENNLTIRTFRYLGYADEESFIPGITNRLLNRMRFYGLSTDRFEQALEFVTRAYEDTGPQKRKSGEKTICHFLRTCWYYLSSKAYQGKLGGKEDSQIESDMVVLLLHDVAEDIRMAELRPYKFSLVLGEADQTDSFHLTSEEYHTLQALTADSDETYLQDIILKDSTGKASELKMYDRIDNLLTMWFRKSWLKLFRKLFITHISMMFLGWHGQTGDSIYKTAKKYTYLRTGKQWENILPASLLSHGFLETAIETVKWKLYCRMLEKHNVELRDAEIEKWFSQLVEEESVIAGADLPAYFSTSRIIDDFINRQDNIQQSSSVTVNNIDPYSISDHVIPFEFEDLVPFLKDVQRILVENNHETPDFPGHVYDCWRKTPSSTRWKRRFKYWKERGRFSFSLNIRNSE